MWRYLGEFVRHPQRRQESKENRDMLLEIIRCTRYLARQGVTLRDPSNNEGDGNFIQLLMLTGEKDDRIKKLWLKKRKNKYTSKDIQNELLPTMTLFVLRKIAMCIARSGWYTIIGDEVTDCGNKEQFVMCMRWINDNLEAVESFIGLYNVDNIKVDTMVVAIKDVLLRMNLS